MGFLTLQEPISFLDCLGDHRERRHERRRQRKHAAANAKHAPWHEMGVDAPVASFGCKELYPVLPEEKATRGVTTLTEKDRADLVLPDDAAHRLLTPLTEVNSDEEKAAGGFLAGYVVADGQVTTPRQMTTTTSLSEQDGSTPRTNSTASKISFRDVSVAERDAVAAKDDGWTKGNDAQRRAMAAHHWPNETVRRVL